MLFIYAILFKKIFHISFEVSSTTSLLELFTQRPSLFLLTLVPSSLYLYINYLRVKSNTLLVGLKSAFVTIKVLKLFIQGYFI